MKHFLRLGTAVVALAFSFSLTAFANTRNEITMGSIQNDLLEYLEVNHPEIEFGSKEYIDYVSRVAVTGPDEDLEKLENIDDIEFYCCQYLHELDEEQAKGNLQSQDFFVPSEEFNSTTIGEISERVKEEDRLDEIRYQELKSQRPQTIRASYDVDEAVSYAKEYAKRYNISFPGYLSDCTNFVSQCVFAGGIDMDYPYDIPGGTEDTTRYWYCLPAGAFWKNTSSWINVDDFYEYCIKEANAEKYEYRTLSALEQGVEIGDVVQLKNTQSSVGGDWYHSIIITDYDENDGYLYCGHTSNAKDEPLDQLSEDRRYRIIRF